MDKIEDFVANILVECRAIRVHIIDLWRKGERIETKIGSENGPIRKIEKRLERLEEIMNKLSQIIRKRRENDIK